MKKVTLLFLFFAITNCGTQKIETKDRQKVIDLLNEKNYYLTLPENWGYILDSHNDLSITPSEFGDIFYKNIIRIYKTSKENNSLKEYVNERIDHYNERTRIESQNLKTENTRYGDSFIFTYDNYWNSTHYMHKIKYFEYNNAFYVFSYTSDKRYFEKSLKDVEFVFNSLVFKK